MMDTVTGTFAFKKPRNTDVIRPCAIDLPCTTGRVFQTLGPKPWGAQNRSVSESLPGCRERGEKPYLAIYSNFRRILDSNGNWHGVLMMCATNTWWEVNKGQSRKILIHDGRVNVRMAEKTYPLIVDLLSSEDSDTGSRCGTGHTTIDPERVPGSRGSRREERTHSGVRTNL